MATILVVDDVAANRAVLASILTREGHRTLQAADGHEALNAARTEHPALIITDILMPTMDGYELVRRIREDETLAKIPVMFWTAYYHSQDARNLAEACGVHFILTKPCEPDQVAHTVQLALSDTVRNNRPHTGDFDRQHIRLISDKLSSTAEELRLANEKLSALIDMNLRLASERDPETLLQGVCDSARSLTSSKYAFVLVRSQRTDELKYFKMSGTNELFDGVGLDNPFTEWLEAVLGTEKSARLEKSQGNWYTTFSAAGSQPSSALVVSVASLKRTYGWLCLFDKLGAEEFDADDQKLMEIFGAQVGRIYENGSLYFEVQQQAESLRFELAERSAAEEKIKRLNRVHAMQSSINSLTVRVRNRADLFRETCAVAIREGGFRLAWIGMVDRSSLRISPSAWGGETTKLANAIDNDLLDDSPFCDALRNRVVIEQKPMLTNRVKDDTLGLAKTELLANGLVSSIIIPLVIESETVGTLALYSSTEDFFDEGETGVLLELADDVAFAVDHLEKTAKLDYLAFFDTLTGFANERLFRDRLNQYIASQEKRKGKLAVCFLDMNRFNTISESHDRRKVDSLLKKIAGRLTEMAPDTNGLGFFPPNRFGLILPAAENEDETARLVSQCIARCFDVSFEYGEIDVKLSANAGIAMYPADGDDAEDLIKFADVAAVRSKTADTAYLFYTQKMTERVSQRLVLETKLYNAVKNEEFVLHYQPKYDIETNTIHSVEALIRWQSPELGLVPPLEFISVLEETGIIVEVGIWAMKEAVRSYDTWKLEGKPAPRIAVNVSAVQLRQKNVVESFARVIGQKGNAAGVDIEITESLSVENISDGIGKLKAIRDLGIPIAVDDFGTGYSSLGYLAKLPVQAIKIDRSFVIAMHQNEAVLTLVSTMISMAHSLGLKVVAEGVDSQEQIDILRQFKCDELQGYFISKPLPKPELEQFLLAWENRPRQ